MFNRSKKEATRIERVASSMNTGALVDFLKQYVNSIGQATVVYAENGDPVALDVIGDNTTAIDVIVAELRSRQKEGRGFAPPPEPHIQELTEKYLRRRALREQLAQQVASSEPSQPS